jgi:hypothetical protein
MKKDFTRVQFDFSAESLKRVDNLKIITESPTKAEVVRKALRVYEYVVTMVKDGYSMTFDKDGDKISVPPLLL